MNNGLIFDIRRFSVHDGPGIRTTLFFKGCPLSCWWCHNPESQDTCPEKTIRTRIISEERFEKPEITGRFMTVDEVMDEVLPDQLFYEESGGGVTFSGGEPLMQEVFLTELLQACKQQGLHTVLDTSGYASPDIIAKVAPYVDLFLYDLKLMDHALHKKYTGVSNKSILANLSKLFRTGKKIIFRFPVIPGITDTTENIRLLKEFIVSLTNRQTNNQELSSGGDIFEIHLLPYHSMAREKYRRFSKSNRLPGLPDLLKEDLIPLKQEFESMGGKVVLGG